MMDKTRIVFNTETREYKVIREDTDYVYYNRLHGGEGRVLKYEKGITWDYSNPIVPTPIIAYSVPTAEVDLSKFSSMEDENVKIDIGPEDDEVDELEVDETETEDKED